MDPPKAVDGSDDANPEGTSRESRTKVLWNKGSSLLKGAGNKLHENAKMQENYGLMEWVARFLVFAANFGTSIFLLVICAMEATPCMINYTYRQDMALNVVGNPYYSSTGTWRRGPAAKLETQYYGVENQTQVASDIMMFPNMVVSEYQNAGFLPVRPAVHLMLGADEYLAHEYTVQNYYFYWDQDLLGIRPVDLPSPDAAATPDVIAQMSGSLRPGMQVPNLYRCAKKLYGEESQKIREGVQAMAKNTHLRGACLLSGQQHTVDISSNYRSSMIFFSSINPMFMVAVVCWICASFSLFELGNTDMKIISRARTWLSDLTFGVSTVWNIILMVIALLPAFRDDAHVPLNNALIAEALLAITIFVQWRIATKLADPQMKDSAAAAVLEKNEGARGGDDASVTRGIPVADPMKRPKTASILVCTASSFLSAAASASSGKPSLDDIETARSGRALGSTNTARRREAVPLRVPKPPVGSPFENMPYFHHMIKTGDALVIRDYIKEVRSTSNLDCVQHIEFVLTIPILFTVITAATVSFIPTGVLQQIFVMVTVSHILCTPIIYVARRTFKLEKGNSDNKYAGNHFAVALLFVAFFMMQLIAIAAKWDYMNFTWGYYGKNNGHFFSAAVILTALQSVLIAMVFFIALPCIMIFVNGFTLKTDKPSEGFLQPYHRMSEFFLDVGWIVYAVLGFTLRLTIIWLIYNATYSKDFSLYSCDVWHGKYGA